VSELFDSENNAILAAKADCSARVLDGLIGILDLEEREE
jgi:hypothetical protein